MVAPRDLQAEAGRRYLLNVRTELDLSVVGTPLPTDSVALPDGTVHAWKDLGFMPKVPPAWWMHLPDQSPISMSHEWLRSKHFVANTEPTLLQLFLVSKNQYQLPADYLCEVLPDDFTLREICVHLDAHLRAATSANEPPAAKTRR